MYGAVIGDIIGSTFEFREVKKKEIPLFAWGSDYTDDTILTIAVARALLQWKAEGGDLHRAMCSQMRELGRKYPSPLGSYGIRFSKWLHSSNPTPYNSCGNGSAMRVSPCGLMAGSLEEALELAKISAEVTHNHPEGIKGAQAVAAAIFLARTGRTKEEIREYIQANFYPLDRTLEEIRPDYSFDGTCQGSVPESIIAFLESESFEDAIRNTISLGGDADTMGAITGSIAWSYYMARNNGKLMEDMRILMENAEEYLPREFRDTIEEFRQACWSSGV